MQNEAPTTNATPTPEHATVTLGGSSLTLGTLTLRQLKRRLADIETMNGVRSGMNFTEAQVDAMLRIVGDSHAAAGGDARTVEAFFLDAPVKAYEAMGSLAEAYLLAQGLAIPKVDEAKAGASGEEGAR